MPKTTAEVERPVLIDAQDGPCEICAKHRAGICDKCGAKEYFDPKKDHGDHTVNLQGNGFRTVKPSHFHLVPVLGINGREAVWGEVCIKCYRAEHKTVYGKTAL